MAPDSASTAGAGRGSVLISLSFILLGAAVATAAGILVGAPVHAATWTVRSDGSGTSATIQAAVNSAAPGDTVDIGPGLFYERVSIVDKSLLVRGAGRDVTEINGYPHGNVFALRGYGNYTEIRGLTIKDGHADVYTDPGGGGVYGGGVLGDGAVFALVDCRVTACFGNLGGAVYATSLRIIPEGGAADRAPRGSRARRGFAPAGAKPRLPSPGLPHDVILLRDCLFDANTGGAEGGAFYFENAYFDVENCEIAGNWAGQGGGGHIFDSVGSVTGCVFRDNEALLDGGALETEQNIPFTETSVLISRNTLVSNRAGREGSAVFIPHAITIDYDNNILALNGGDAPTVVACGPSDAEYHGTCNLYWANTGAPLGNCAPVPGDLTADPLFCGAPSGDFRLCETSPALTGACGSRGALGVGCAGAGCATAVVPTTWGAIKSLHRP